MDIAVVVQGAFLVGDSIANDAFWQSEVLKRLVGREKVSLFVENFAQEVFPGVECRPYRDVDSWLLTHPAGVVIYHFCDGWRAFEARLLNFSGRKIVRWHNNTPPWFYVAQPNALRGTVRGLKRIRELASEQKLEVWANSDFSVRQLKILVNDRQRAFCVYPASNYLETNVRIEQRHRLSASYERGATLRLLFVGRVVAHKGHKHVIAVADLIARVRGCRVVVDFVGRRDESATVYNEELANLAQAARCEVVFHGGLPQGELDGHYNLSDVFLCLSEHEGFGLPAFEAMRRGLPVVAWAITAYEELLAGSPLALRKFDLASFAAAVEIAVTPAHQDAIKDLQSKLLARYTRGIVLKQIRDGLGLESPELPNPDTSGDLSRQSEALRLAIAKAADVYRLFESEAVGAQATHDFVGNYISAHDVEYFDYFLESQDPTRKLLEVLKVEGSPAIAAARLSPCVFLSKNATLEEGVYRFRDLSVEHGHLIHGPYINMPAGRFGFRFQMRLSQFRSASPLHVEVVSNQRVVASRPFENEGERSEGYVEHEFLTPQSDVELRICAHERVELSGEFEGVVVERLPSLSALVPDFGPYSRIESAGHAGPGAVLLLPARSFNTRRGHLREEGYELEIEPSTDNHLFFGPYIEIPKGRYEIAIDIEMAATVQRKYVEIADEGVLIGRHEVQVGPDGKIIFEVSLERDVAKGEFRFQVQASAPSRALFRGVAVKRLAALSSLLAEGKIFTPQGIKVVSGEPRSVFFEPRHFVSAYAEHAEDYLIFHAQTVPAGAHLIYGPYIAVPPGRFRFRLHFDFVRFETEDLVEIDVANEGQRITYRPLRASLLNENTTIECEFLAPIARCEFRLAARAQADILGFFRGVTAESLPSLARLASVAPPGGAL